MRSEGLSPVSQPHGTAPANAAAPAHKNRFSVSRTAGSMPVWKASAEEAGKLALNDTRTDPVIKPNAGQPAPSFADFIDIINPLQHIPIVSTIYRKATGDVISPGARMLGDTLFGGPIGAATAMANIAMEDKTGKDLTGNIIDRMVSTPRSAAPQPIENSHFAALIDKTAGGGTYNG